MGSNAFRQYVRGKEIYLFGAGRALESCLDIYFNVTKVRNIIDNNPDLWGRFIKHDQEEIEIIGKEKFISQIKDEKLDNILLLITSTFYASEIIEDLDMHVEIDGLDCFLQILIRNTKEETQPFKFSKGAQKIPKKIHYVWIGGKELPIEYKKNIDSWKKYNPDYEIIQWDESNYDFTKMPYMKAAYESNEWSFASNYARLDIISKYGGIYLDTDVEVIKNLDSLLNDDAFFCMGCTDRVNLGCGFGAVKQHPIILDMMKQYASSNFLLGNGRLNKKPGHVYFHPVIRNYGFEICNKYQNQKGIALYPMEVMSPLTILNMDDFISDKTLSIHQESGTWKDEKEKMGMVRLKKIIARLHK